MMSKVTKILSDEEFLFRLSTAIKVMIPALASYLLLGGYLWNLLQIDLIFFEANGFSGLVELREAYFDFILSTTLSKTPYIAGLFILIFGTGLYISYLMLRPFKIIGRYCEKKLAHKQTSYDPDFFSDLRLLTRFSEYFFNFMENAEKHRDLRPQDVPKAYTRIHRPVFENSFFLQQFFFILIISIAVSISITVIMNDVHHDVVQLATKTLNNASSVTYFLNKQKEIFDNVTWLVIGGNIMFYVLLSFHLYSKVAAPAFGIFATMRSFIKGNYSSKIHLVGHYYLRPQCRIINKYLTHCQNINKNLNQSGTVINIEEV